MNLDTYHGWALKGRAVLQGQKAKQYVYFPDGSTSAVFHLDQTGEHNVQDINTGEIVSVEEHRARKTKPEGPRLKIRLETSTAGDKFFVWCGSNKRSIELMKTSHALYDQTTNRWTFTRDNADVVIAELERRGYVIDLDDQRLVI